MTEDQARLAECQAKLKAERSKVRWDADLKRDTLASLENAHRINAEKDLIIDALFMWECDPADIRTLHEFLDDLGKRYPSAKRW